jgi:plasmid stability protein
MAVLTVRNVPDEIHRALRLRAAENGRSTEAEVRAILAAAVNPDQRLRIGDALGALGRELDFTDDDVATLKAVRDKAPATPPALP